MPQVTLQPDSENGRVWIMLAGQRLVSLRAEDQEGLKVVTTWLVRFAASKSALKRPRRCKG